MIPWGVTVHIVEPGVFSKTGLYGTFQTGLDEKWRELDPKLKEAYGEDFYKFVRKNMGEALADFGNTNSELVPLAMIEGKIVSCSCSVEMAISMLVYSAHVEHPEVPLPSWT